LLAPPFRLAQFPITALREIKILKVLRHPNVVCLREIVTSAASESNHGKGSIYMVFEYMDHDLTGLMDSPSTPFSVPQVCARAQQPPPPAQPLSPTCAPASSPGGSRTSAQPPSQPKRHTLRAGGVLGTCRSADIT
jgi:muconolactone delta-isomerase